MSWPRSLLRAGVAALSSHAAGRLELEPEPLIAQLPVNARPWAAAALASGEPVALRLCALGLERHHPEVAHALRARADALSPAPTD